jgi:integrase
LTRALGFSDFNVMRTSETVKSTLARSDPQPQLRAITLEEALYALLAETAARVEGGVRSAGTLCMQRQHVRYILGRLPADLPVTEVDEETIDELVALEGAGRRKRSDGTLRPIAASTILKRLSTLRRALKLQKRRRVIDRLPEFPEILSAYRPDRKFIRSYAEALAIATALPPIRADWFWLALWTGQHSSDVERMTREDIHPGGPDRWVRVRNTKNRRFDGLRIACPAELARVIRARWLALKPGALLVEPWPHVSSSQLPDTCERIGLPRYTAKSLRHTFFTWMISKVGITKAVMEIGGWSSYEMVVKVYGHALPPQFRAAVRALDHFVIDEARRPPRSANQRSPSGLQAPAATAEKMPPPVLQAPGAAECQPSQGTTGVTGRLVQSGGDPQKERVGPAGFEPAAYGLKVPPSRDRLLPDRRSTPTGAAWEPPPG